MLESINEELHKLKTDKLMLIVCLIIPICVNLIIGWELTKGVIDHVPMAIVDYDDSQLSRQIIRYFKENEAFDVTYQIQNEAELKKLLDESKVRVGMVIPKNFSADVTSLKSPTVLMMYDGSHMSMVSVAKAKASEILISVRVGASVQQIQNRLNKSYDEAFTMAMPISFETRMLYNPAKSFNYFMTPGYGTIICQLGIAFMAVVSVTVNWDKEKKRNDPGYIVGKVFFYGVLGSLATIINLLIQIYLFNIPYRGSFMAGIAMSILFIFAVAGLAVAVSAWFNNRVLAMTLLGLLLIPNSIMAGYTWPVISMIPSYKWMSKFIPFTHYGDNIRDLFLKGKMIGGISDARFLMLYLVVMILLAVAGVTLRKLGKPKEADDR